MRSLPVGALVAAIVMFVLGFVFFGLLGSMLAAPLDPARASAIQALLAEQLNATGDYMVPADEESWMRGPSAIVKFVVAGGTNSMPVAMGLGYLHLVVSALIMGLGLRAAGGDAGRRMSVAFWYGLAATVFMHLGDPVWYGFAWRTTLIKFAFDGIMFIAGGLVLARWFTAERAAPAATV